MCLPDESVATPVAPQMKTPEPPLAGTKYCLVKEHCVHERLAQSRYETANVRRLIALTIFIIRHHNTNAYTLHE